MMRKVLTLLLIAMLADNDMGFAAKIQPRVIPLYGRVGRGLDISHADNAVLAAQMTFCAAGSVTICENGCCPNQNWVCCGGEWLCASTKTDCETLKMLKNHPWNKNSTEVDDNSTKVEKDCIEKNTKVVSEDEIETVIAATLQICQNECKSRNECNYFWFRYIAAGYCTLYDEKPETGEQSGSYFGGKNDIDC